MCMVRLLDMPTGFEKATMKRVELLWGIRFNQDLKSCIVVVWLNSIGTLNHYRRELACQQSLS